MPRVQIYGRDYVLIVCLGMMAALVLSNWETYSECRDPLGLWEFVDYVTFIVFRLVQFAFQYASSGPRTTCCGLRVPKLLAMFNLWVMYPFLWAWTILGCVWFHQSGDCLPGSTSGFVIWLAFSVLYLVLFAWLLFTTYQIRNRARPPDMGELEYMQSLLVTMNRAQNNALPIIEGMSDDEIAALGTRTIQRTDVTPEHLESGTAQTGITCAICLVDVNVGEQVRDLACAHPFHTACVDHWLRTNNTCPTCRAAARPAPPPPPAPVEVPPAPVPPPRPAAPPADENVRTALLPTKA